ncbi:MAG: efflux RND transporter permease subunit, partial [Pseudomonadota bacterium]
WVIDHFYDPLLRRAIKARGVTLALFIALLILSSGLFAGGFLRFVIFPELPGDYLFASASMQTGTPSEERNAALMHIQESVYAVRDRYLEDTPGATDPLKHVATFTETETRGSVIVEMPPVETQTLNGDDLASLWREQTGDIPGVRTVQFTNGNVIGGGQPLSFKLTGDNIDTIEAAADELANVLRSYAGIFDLRNSASAAGDEIELAVKPGAEALGITLNALGTQVRQSFYGEEVQRIQRGKDELKVMLRYPQEDRRSIDNLQTMLVTTPDGDRVPFTDVAEVRYGNAYASIERQDGKRTVTVSADIDTTVAEPREVIADINENYIPQILARYPGVEYALEGASLEEQQFLNNLIYASIAAMFLIYALIAIPLKSYTQPLIIMSVIPFGFVGATVGHLLLGLEISMFSLFGLIALAGVVVNDSLIMIDFVNKAREEGTPLYEAVVESGKARFRAIILTSLTTAIGLVPIMMETSAQAQFVIPMAVSISFGILFATLITLILVPTLYLLQEDVLSGTGKAWRWLMGRSPQHQSA